MKISELVKEIVDLANSKFAVDSDHGNDGFMVANDD